MITWPTYTNQGWFKNGICFLVFFGYSWYLFRTIYMHPGSLYLSLGFDSIKNYYVYLFQVLYDSGFHFTGLNYPYGEHVTYTDNQPFLAVPLSWLRPYLRWNIQTYLAIMNLMIPLAFLLSCWYLYKTLLRLSIHWVLSVFGSLFIIGMSPHLFRIFGHFGLSYSFFVVITFYHLIKYVQTAKWSSLFILFFVLFVSFFAHAYQFAICAFLVVVFGVAYILIMDGNFMRKVKKALALWLPLILSLIAIQGLLFFTDLVSDRTKVPYGVLDFCSKDYELFTSEISSLGRSFVLFFNRQQGAVETEGYGYIGFLPNLYLLFFLIQGLLFLLRKNSNLLIYVSPSRWEKILLIIGLCAFLFASLFSFSWDVEWLFYKLPFVRQFRSLGRFSILLYFSMGIACLLAIQRIFDVLKQRKKQVLAAYFGFVVVFFWSIEVLSYSKYIQPRVDHGTDDFSQFFAGELNEIDSKENHTFYKQFQCIIAMPFFVGGSDKVGITENGATVGASYREALVSGLPLVNTYMARSSISQSFTLMRLIGGPLTDKEEFYQHLNVKPILLLHSSDYEIYKEEQYLIDHADFIKKEKGFDYYRLDWKALQRKEKRLRDSLLIISMTSLPPPPTDFFTNHFDEGNSREVFFSKGAQSVYGLDSLEIFNGSYPFDTASTYEFSMWALAYDMDYRMPSAQLFFYNQQNEQIGFVDVLAKVGTDNEGLWCRMASDFKCPADTKKLRVVYRGDKGRNAAAIDEMQIRPLDFFSMYEYRLAKERLCNNHKLN